MIDWWVIESLTRNQLGTCVGLFQFFLLLFLSFLSVSVFLLHLFLSDVSLCLCLCFSFCFCLCLRLQADRAVSEQLTRNESGNCAARRCIIPTQKKLFHLRKNYSASEKIIPPPPLGWMQACFKFIDPLCISMHYCSLPGLHSPHFYLLACIAKHGDSAPNACVEMLHGTAILYFNRQSIAMPL